MIVYFVLIWKIKLDLKSKKQIKFYFKSEDSVRPETLDINDLDSKRKNSSNSLCTETIVRMKSGEVPPTLIAIQEWDWPDV